MEENLQFPVACILCQIVEIILTKLKIEQDVIGQLSIKLHPGPAQADIKGLAGGCTQHACARVTLISPKPDLAKKSSLDVVAAVFVELQTKFFDFFFGFRLRLIGYGLLLDLRQAIPRGKAKQA